MIPAVARMPSPEALNAVQAADTLALPWATPEPFCSGLCPSEYPARSGAILFWHSDASDAD